MNLFKGEKIDFYERCAEILGVNYECTPHPYSKRTRWNNRAPGSGRYPGIGIIRKFGKSIQVCFSTHKAVYTSEEEVYDALMKLRE